MSEGERRLAAEISADPAFTALEASGAPIVAFVGEEPRIVYANAAAAAVFGAPPDARLVLAPDGGGERLQRLMEQLRKSAAPRLERLPLAFADETRCVTVLCRRLTGQTPVYVVAALGLRGAAEPAETEAAAEPALHAAAPEATDPGLQALREKIVAHHGAAARFLWKTDGQGCFTEVTHVLADVAGAANADILGRDIEELSRALGLGRAFADALATRRSWANVRVDWPIDEPFCAAPTTLGALPLFDAARRFSGYQGYGVLRLDQAIPRGVEAPAPEPPKEPQREPPPVEKPPADNIVPLRPAVSAAPRDGNDEARRSALSPVEKGAFDEIGRALAAQPGAGPPPSGPARDLIEHVARALESARAPATALDAVSGLVDVLPIGVLVARGSTPLYANKTLLDYLGYADLEQLSGHGGLGRLFAGPHPGRLPQPDPASVRAVELTAQDGELVDVDAQVQSVAWEAGPATLISLRRHLAAHADGAPAAEIARLAAENEALAAAFDANGEAEALVSDAGRIERANPAFARLCGVKPQDAAGRALASLFGEEDAGRVAAFFAGVGETGEIHLSGQRRLQLRGLGLKPKKLVCALLREDSSADALARAAAERASALKSEFLARVSHEIRTPLSAILGFAEVMIEERFGPIGSERYKEYLKDVHASGQHVLSLVNDLLDLSKIESGKLELRADSIDVNAVIGECVSIMQTQASKQRVIMRLSLAPRLPRIRADERSLRQILLNLLSNAVKFNVPGGQVIVSTTQTDAGYVVIRVKDTGIGMSDDEIELALEPFRQVETSRKTQGTGLGLPVTKALIEANHATLMIRSRKNEGTLIEVGFPPRPTLAAE